MSLANAYLEIFFDYFRLFLIFIRKIQNFSMPLTVSHLAPAIFACLLFGQLSQKFQNIEILINILLKNSRDFYRKYYCNPTSLYCAFPDSYVFNILFKYSFPMMQCYKCLTKFSFRPNGM